MSFFKSKQSSSEQQSIDNDGSGFLHPESSLSSNRDLDTTTWSKERTSQQLELENANNNTSNQNCCSKLIEYTIKSLFVIDICIGIILIIYGSLILTQFDKESVAMAAVIFSLLFGSIHFTTSVFGCISLFWKGCKRNGLVLVGYVGPYVALVYFTIVIALLADTSGFLQYLDDHKEVMYLGDNVVENTKRLMPLIYVVLIVLGILEASRFCVLIKLQKRLVENDANGSLIPRSTRDDTTMGGGSSVVSGNRSLTEALLEDSSSVETGSRRETTGTPSWWEK